MCSIFFILIFAFLFENVKCSVFLDHIPGFESFDKSILGFNNQTSFYQVDIEDYTQDLEYKMKTTGKFGESFIGPNY